MSGPTPTTIQSRDGTPIAVFRSGPPDGSPLLLVHGTAADHTTFRVIAPMLARTWSVHAIDRRGRGASDDTTPYAIEREFEDVVAVAAVAAADSGREVDVVGHSYGGRCALGAALRTTTIGRVVSYEGAPAPPGASYHPDGIDAELAALAAAGRPDELLATFLRRVVGMTETELAAYRTNPVWPARVAAAPTIVRELAAEADPAASLETLGNVNQPVLQILGDASLPVFRASTIALDRRLADGRIVVIAGAKHAAHHTRPDALVAAIEAFLRPVP